MLKSSPTTACRMIERSCSWPLTFGRGRSLPAPVSDTVTSTRWSGCCDSRAAAPDLKGAGESRERIVGSLTLPPGQPTLSIVLQCSSGRCDTVDLCLQSGVERDARGMAAGDCAKPHLFRRSSRNCWCLPSNEPRSSELRTGDPPPSTPPQTALLAAGCNILGARPAVTGPCGPRSVEKRL